MGRQWVGKKPSKSFKRGVEEKELTEKGGLSGGGDKGEENLTLAKNKHIVNKV